MINKRVRILRKDLGLTLEKFGERLGVTKVAISNIENGNRNVTEQMIKAICREFSISEDWLRTGDGDMYEPIEDETAVIVSELLEKSNPFYDIIKGIMKTYLELDEKSKKVLCDTSQRLLDNLETYKKTED